MKRESRVRALEARMTGDTKPITLFRADRATAALRGGHDRLLKLFRAIHDPPDLTAQELVDLELY